MKILRSLTLSLAGAALLTLLASCVEPPPGSESQIWQRPPRYGHGGTEQAPKLPGGNTKAKPGNQQNQGASGSRFGYSGDEAGAPGSNANNPAPTDTPAERPRDGQTTAAADKPAAEPPKEEKKPSGPPSVSQMPFAKGVPGKPLSVTLPSPNDKLGEISIEQFEGGKPSGKPLPPGTPVEIPDPGNPGKKIYFRVP
ncbi:MAG: hypothetical protein JNK37_00440 [Verrucomicrobiales bacterium]|nr:hypothetical protein [Verrucomicrobiales bacterium]